MNTSETPVTEKPKRKNKNDFEQESHVLRVAILAVFPLAASVSIFLLLSIFRSILLYSQLNNLIMAGGIFSFGAAIFLIFYWQMWRIRAIADALLILFSTGIGVFLSGLALMMVIRRLSSIFPGRSPLEWQLIKFMVISSPLFLIALWFQSHRTATPFKPRFIKPNTIILLALVSPLFFLLALMSNGGHVTSQAGTSDHIYLIYDYGSSSDGYYSRLYECNSLGYLCNAIDDFRVPYPELVQGEHDNVLVLIDGEVVFDSSEDS